MHRRSFLLSLSAIGLAATACSGWHGRRGRLRILMLGGTNFVGPHLVQAALGRGHQVTLFNRGRTNPHLFPEVEKLRGDRYPDRGEGPGALDTSRTWDAVIDTWQEAPGCVDLTARMLAPRAERYVYISSIATYRGFRDIGITEGSPMIEAAERVGSFDSELGYRARKRAGEQAVEGHFGARATVLRCTSIGGRNYSADANQHASYWATRFLAAEPLIVPDDPGAVVQLIDVKDMARFAIDAIEKSLGGAYNVVGPEQPLSLRDYVRTWSEATSGRSPIVWVTPAFLAQQGVRPFDDIPSWIPESDSEPGFYRISNARARRDGLTFRPLASTLHDEIAGLGDPASLRTPGGMSREKERELIESWQRMGG